MTQQNQSWIADLLAGYKLVQNNGADQIQRNILNLLDLVVSDNPSNTGRAGLFTGSSDLKVTGLQGRAISSTAPTDGQVLTWVAVDSKWEPKPASGGGSSITGTGLWYSATGTLNSAAVGFSGDVALSALSGGNVPTAVVQLSGSGGSTTLASNLTPGADLTYSLGTSAERMGNVVANAHQAFAASGDAQPSAVLAPGRVAFGAGGASAVDTRLTRTGANLLTLDNASSGAASLIVGGTSATSPLELQGSGLAQNGTGAANAAAASLTIATQAVNATNGSAGSVTISIPAPTGTGSEGQLVFERGGSTFARLGAYPPTGNTAVAQGALWLGETVASAPSTTNNTLYADQLGAVYLNATASVLLAVNMTPQINISPSEISVSPVVAFSSGIQGNAQPLTLGHTTVTLGHGGTTVLTSTQYQNPILVLSDTGLTSDATVQVPATAGSIYYVTTALVVNGGHSIFLNFGGGPTVTLAAAASVVLFDGNGAFIL